GRGDPGSHHLDIRMHPGADGAAGRSDAQRGGAECGRPLALHADLAGRRAGARHHDGHRELPPVALIYYHRPLRAAALLRGATLLPFVLGRNLRYSLRDVDVVTQGLEASDETARGPGPVALVEVVDSQVCVGRALADHVVHDGEDGSGHSDDGLSPVARGAAEAVELRAEVAVF